MAISMHEDRLVITSELKEGFDGSHARICALLHLIGEAVLSDQASAEDIRWAIFLILDMLPNEDGFHDIQRLRYPNG